MRTLSPHFFMEVIVKLLHKNVDKYATLNIDGDVIHYTEKTNPKLKRTIDLTEGERIFEDLYGSTIERWVVSSEYASKPVRKSPNRGIAGKRNIKRGRKSTIAPSPIKGV